MKTTVTKKAEGCSLMHKMLFYIFSMLFLTLLPVDKEFMSRFAIASIP